MNRTYKIKKKEPAQKYIIIVETASENFTLYEGFVKDLMLKTFNFDPFKVIIKSAWGHRRHMKRGELTWHRSLKHLTGNDRGCFYDYSLERLVDCPTSKPLPEYLKLPKVIYLPSAVQ